MKKVRLFILNLTTKLLIKITDTSMPQTKNMTMIWTNGILFMSRITKRCNSRRVILIQISVSESTLISILSHKWVTENMSIL